MKGKLTLVAVFFLLINLVRAQHPASFPGLVFWLRADTGLVMSGNTISEWDDVSGNAVPCYPNNVLPLVNAIGAINNRPAAYFNDCRLGLSVSPTFNPILNFSNYTILFVGKLNPTQGACYIYDFNAANNHCLSTVAQGIGESGQAVRVPLDSSAFFIYTKQYDSSAVPNTAFFFNTIDQNLGYNYAKPDFAGSRWIGGSPSGDFMKQGYIAEFIIYNRKLGAGELAAVHNYLLGRYSQANVDLGPDRNLNSFCPQLLQAGNGYKSYEWSTGDSVSSISVSNPGKYWVKTVNAFDVPSSDTIYINYPQVAQLVDTILCAGASLNWNPGLDKSNYTYSWQDLSTDSAYTITQAGNYYVEIKDAFNCSYYSDTVVIAYDDFNQYRSYSSDTVFCSGNFLAPLHDTSIIASYLWNNGTSNSLIQVNQPTGFYTYWVDLVDTIGCPKRDSILVEINGVAPTPSYSFDSLVCFGGPTNFADFSLPPVGDTIVAWLWDFGDTASANNSDTIVNPQHTYSNPGTYTSKLTIRTSAGCAAVATKTVHIYPIPVADFVKTNLNSCTNNPTLFSNLSNTFGNLVAQYSWDFGDTASGLANNSALKNPQHSYHSPGNYTVWLKVKTIYGCSDSISKNIVVIPSSIADFSAPVTCEGKSVQVIDASALPFPRTVLSNSWNFNDGSAVLNSAIPNLISNVSHLYQNPVGTHQVTLIITDSKGCKDSVTKTVFVVEQPTADFSFTKNCLNAATEFTDLSTQSNNLGLDSIYSRTWKFDNAASSTLVNPNYKFSGLGNHSARLIVQTLQGCSDTLLKTVTLVPLPTASFIPSETVGDPPLLVDFVNTSSSNALFFSWNFGDGDSSILQQPQHLYTDTGTFAVKLTVNDSNQCKASAQKSIFVKTASIDIAILALRTVVDDENFVQIEADIQNRGTRKITALDMYAFISGHPPMREQLKDTLSIAESITFKFAAQERVNGNGENNFICIEARKPNGVDDYFPSDNQLCKELYDNSFSLSNPFPNPANDEILISYVLPDDGLVEMSVYDQIGNLIIDNKKMGGSKGLNRFYLNLSAVSSGVYAIRLKYKDKLLVKRFIKWSEKN